MVEYPVDNVPQDGIAAEGRRRPGAWLWALLRTDFFRKCEVHTNIQQNFYCMDCSVGMCQKCADDPAGTHASHCRLQIRRYVYQNVVQVEDMEEVLDCSDIQLFTLNGAKVVLLMPRRQRKSRANTGGMVACMICKKMVMEPYKFCSVTCKVSEEPVNNGSSSGNQVAAAPSFLPSLESDLEDVSSQHPSDLSVKNVDGHTREASPPKKRHRRKGVPRRAPFF